MLIQMSDIGPGLQRSSLHLVQNRRGLQFRSDVRIACILESKHKETVPVVSHLISGAFETARKEQARFHLCLREG